MSYFAILRGSFSGKARGDHILLAVIVFVLLLGTGAWRIAASDNSTVNHGANLNITAHSNCRNVTNNSSTGRAVYVPTQTDAEWQSFREHPPSGVTLANCLPQSQTFTLDSRSCGSHVSPSPMGSFNYKSGYWYDGYAWCAAWYGGELSHTENDGSNKLGNARAVCLMYGYQNVSSANATAGPTYQSYTGNGTQANPLSSQRGFQTVGKNDGPSFYNHNANNRVLVSVTCYNPAP